MIELAELQQATSDERRETAKSAVVAASGSEEKKQVAAAAFDALSPEERKDLITSMWPIESVDRRWVYVVGFIVAGAVALGLALIAWGASGNDSGIATSMIVLATGFSSAILGGLLGAYINR